MDASLNKELQKLALEIRIGIVEEIQARGFGHIGGSLSLADALAVLYGAVMRYDSQNPKWPDRDKLVCSKGHAGPGVYATLAVKGFFPYEDLKTLNQPGTYLPSHCDKNKTPGVDMTTGSLGQGTSAAVGIALGDRLKGRDSRTYLLVGDGESDEGQVWEAAMFTAAKKITNLIWLVDDNKKQLDGYTQDVLPIFDLIAKTGNIPERDMFNTYNMGVGMSIVVPAAQVQTALDILTAHGEDAYVIGTIVKNDEEKVILE